MYIKLREGARYNRSTGKIEVEDYRKNRAERELTPTEMKIGEVLFDWEWHKMEEIEEKAGIKGQRRRVHISRLKKKIERYIELKIDRKGKRYKCVRTRKKKERR